MHRLCECVRVVKLAETAGAAHRFSWLHHSSLGEEWLCTMAAMLPSGLDSLYSLPPSLSVSLLPLSLSFAPRFSLFYPNFTYSYTLLSCSLYLSSGNTMMIIVESMSNGALDSFLRVSLLCVISMPAYAFIFKCTCRCVCSSSSNKMKPHHYLLFWSRFTNKAFCCNDPEFTYYSAVLGQQNSAHYSNKENVP